MTKDIVDRLKDVELPPVPDTDLQTETEWARARKWKLAGDSDMEKRMRHYCLRDDFKLKIMVAVHPSKSVDSHYDGYLHEDKNGISVNTEVTGVHDPADKPGPDAQEFHAADLMCKFHELNLALCDKPVKLRGKLIRRTRINSDGEVMDLGIKPMHKGKIYEDKERSMLTVWFTSMTGNQLQRWYDNLIEIPADSFNIYYAMQWFESDEKEAFIRLKYLKMILEWTEGWNG